MPLFSDLVEAIRTGMNAMAPPDFNFAHPLPDIHPPASWVLPQSFLEYEAASSQDRTGQVGKHNRSVPLTFRTLVPKGPGKIDVEVQKVFDDFLLLMHQNAPTWQLQGLMLRYEFAGTSWRKRLVATAPAESRITFNLWVRQSRSAPDSP